MSTAAIARTRDKVEIAMCGRVKTPDDWIELRSDWKIRWGEIRDGGRRYNVPPTSTLNVVRYDPERGRGIEPMRWGLIPFWAENTKAMKLSTFNARVETVAKAAAFRNAWKAGRRCLVPVDNFFEWRKTDKQPFAIALANHSTMALGGLWETWTPKDGGDPIKSFTIITVPADGTLGEIHDRAPVIIGAENWGAWLGEEAATIEELIAMLQPIAAERLTMWPVSKALGSVKNEGPELVTPISL